MNYRRLIIQSKSRPQKSPYLIQSEGFFHSQPPLVCQVMCHKNHQKSDV